MATDEDLNTTGSVPATGSPQSPAASPSGSDSEDFQSTANPNSVDSNETLNVQKTGEPISGGSPLTSSSAGGWVLGVIGLVVVVGIVLLIMRIKNFSGASSSTASLKSEADLPRPKAVSSAKAKAKPATKKAAAKKPPVKKKSAKSKSSRKSR